MINGKNVLLRKFNSDDWQIFENWGKNREALWGQFQRHQIEHIPLLKEAFMKTGLLGSEGGMLLIETLEQHNIVGFIRYSMIAIPDADYPYPEIGFGIPEVSARGKGFGKEAVGLIIGYLFSRFPTERIAAFTDINNLPAQRLLESVGFKQEGIIRKSYFRDGFWQDMLFYGLLREECKEGT